MNRFLSDAERRLGSAGNIIEVLQSVARAAVPGLADFCLIFLTRNGDVPCIASAHSTADGERLLRRLNRVYRITRNDPLSTVAHVLRSGRPQLRTEITSEPLLSFGGPQVVALHKRLAPCSALVVPIGAAPNVLGALSLSFAQSSRHYSAHDVPAARRLASAIARFLRQRARASRPPLQVALAGRRHVPLRARG